MSRVEVLEPQISAEVASCRSHAIVVFQAVAGQHERLLLALPLQRLDVEAPQIPLRLRDIGGVRIQMLGGQRRNFRRTIAGPVQVPFGRRRFRRIDGLNKQLVNRRMRFR